MVQSWTFSHLHQPLKTSHHLGQQQMNDDTLITSDTSTTLPEPAWSSKQWDFTTFNHRQEAQRADFIISTCATLIIKYLCFFQAHHENFVNFIFLYSRKMKDLSFYVEIEVDFFSQYNGCCRRKFIYMNHRQSGNSQSLKFSLR